jgi:hypothetical protein
LKLISVHNPGNFAVTKRTENDRVAFRSVFLRIKPTRVSSEASEF